MSESETTLTPRPTSDPAQEAYVAHLEREATILAERRIHLQKRLETAVYEWARAFQWCEAARAQLHVLRTTKGWKALRVLRQIKAQVIDGRHGGAKEFVQALKRELQGVSSTGSSKFDPFAELDGLPYPQPPDALGRLAETAAGMRPVSPVHQADVSSIRLLPPSLVRDGLSGAGATDIVIPIKGALHWLKQCLHTLFSVTLPSEFGRVVVVDDGTSRAEHERLIEIVSQYPYVTLVTNEGPGGFAGACHAGMSRCTGSYVLFLNSDCLVTAGTVRALTSAMSEDTRIGLACALSNNAANVSVPLAPGESYLDLARFFSVLPKEQSSPRDVCTVVGHCLIISRECWEATGGLDLSWGLGYGEESDLHLRAVQKGYRGVVVPRAYVYHFGGGTFRYQETRAELQQANFDRFKERWGEQFTELFSACQTNDPVAAAELQLGSMRTRRQDIDVLFVLPGLSQTVGGTQVVVDIAHHLLAQGLKPGLLILGSSDVSQLYQYQEPLFTHPIFVETEDRLRDDSTIRPRVIVSTLYKTIVPSHRFSRKHGIPHVNFVQGYECYFEAATRFEDVSRLYHIADETIVTSRWLEERLVNHRVSHPVSRLSLGVDTSLFFPRADLGERHEEGLRVALVLRNGPDKGQWVLREIMFRALAENPQISFTVFAGHEYRFEPDERVRVIETPIDRYRLARELRDVDVFIDASFHEGFGLLPLEALACGATVLASDSGGVRDFIREGENGCIVREVNDPERYVAVLQKLLDDPSRLMAQRRAAAESARAFSSVEQFEKYVHFFQRLLGNQSH